MPGSHIFLFLSTPIPPTNFWSPHLIVIYPHQIDFVVKITDMKLETLVMPGT